MITILLRTLIIYLLLIATMRLMGKRQLGELEISDLVTTIMLSEIASLPITNQDIPVLFAIIPILTLVTLEVFLSTAMIKFPGFKKLLSARPAVVICRGKLNPSELTRVRMSFEELLSAVRQEGVTDIDEVGYAIVEQNGKISVIPKIGNQQPDAHTLGLCPTEKGITHLIISDGRIHNNNLKLIGKDEKWLDSVLNERKLRLSDIFYLTVDDTGKIKFMERS